MDEAMAETKGLENEILQKMLTVKELASILNIHTSTVRRWEREGLLAAYRIGPRHSLRFAQEDLSDFLGKSTKNDSRVARK
jgi:excisionase family DNA binding protein